MKKWICIGLFLIGTCSVQAQDLVSDFLAKTKENKVLSQVIQLQDVSNDFRDHGC